MGDIQLQKGWCQILAGDDAQGRHRSPGQAASGRLPVPVFPSALGSSDFRLAYHDVPA